MNSSSSILHSPSSLPALVESTADAWGTPEQLPASDYAPPALTARPHTLDYHERERIYDRIQRELLEIKILAGMASRWPRAT